jgi:hypothetical protein
MLQTLLCYRGRQIGSEDALFIQRLIEENPGWSRRRLSAELCRAWNWVQPNGQLRDMVCRSLLLQLHRAGHIQLPAVRFCPLNNVLASRVRARVPTLPLWEEPIEGSLAQLGPLQIQQVRRTGAEPLFASLLQSHHYLGYTQPVGEHLKYLVWAAHRPVACLAWSSAPRHLASRDEFIGWTGPQRRRNLHGIAYNTRFLILPWVKVPHLASHLLGRMARVISSDWQAIYEHPIHLLETFIDPERFRGTCYRAANWIRLGLSTGRGHNDRTNRPNRSRKELWVYPLSPDFRPRLCRMEES